MALTSGGEADRQPVGRVLAGRPLLPDGDGRAAVLGRLACGHGLRDSAGRAEARDGAERGAQLNHIARLSSGNRPPFDSV